MQKSLIDYASDMEIYETLEECPDREKECVLTIGTYDGIHLGHDAVLERLVVASEYGLSDSVVITFSNRPKSVLNPDTPEDWICTREVKKRLIETWSVNVLVSLTFTEEFSKQTPEEFLRALRKKFPFKKLILGYDAHFGKDRAGDREETERLAQEMGFEVEYLEPVEIDGDPISSTRIRAAIREGDFETASNLLGRTYGFAGRVKPGRGLGTVTGFPTANLLLGDLCTPPFGVYRAWVHMDGMTMDAIANLGIAPTVSDTRQKRLEVHVFGYSGSLHYREIAVVLGEFIRPEKKFASMDELKAQIAADVARARGLFEKSVAESGDTVGD